MAAKKKLMASPLQIALRWLLRVFLYGWGLTIAFPLFWTFATALKSSKVFMAGDVWGWPADIYLPNIVKAWSEANMGSYVFNTLFVVVLSVIVYVIMTTTSSYMIAKYEFRWIKWFEKFYFFAMMIPGMLLLVPLYFQVADTSDWLLGIVRTVTGNPNIDFNLADSLVTLGFIYAAQALPGGIYLLAGFVKSVDKSFMEAAKIDGAGEWYIFTKIIMPFVKPIVLFECLGKFIGTWNEYMTALTFLEDQSKYTLSIGIQKLIAQFGYQSDYGAVFAGLIISLVPILILYLMFQRTILYGTDMSEGLK